MKIDNILLIAGQILVAGIFLYLIGVGLTTYRNIEGFNRKEKKSYNFSESLKKDLESKIDSFSTDNFREQMKGVSDNRNLFREYISLLNDGINIELFNIFSRPSGLLLDGPTQSSFINILKVKEGLENFDEWLKNVDSSSSTPDLKAVPKMDVNLDKAKSGWGIGL